MANQEVAITGIGLICPLGITAPECWENMVKGKSGIKRITSFNTTDCLTKIGGELPAHYFELEDKEFTKRLHKQTSFTSRLGILCAKEAIEDCGLRPERLDPYRCAVITGSNKPNLHSPKELQNPKDSKFFVLQEMINALSSWITIKYAFKGPSFNITAACAAGGYAVGYALDYIRSAHGEVAVVVGVDAMLVPRGLQGLNHLKALTTENEFPDRASRPFDRKRSGFVLANGAGAIVLEKLDHARQRGAKIYALVRGYGISSEAFNIMAPEPSGVEMAKTMAFALHDAKISPDKIGHISSHGTSTHHNDLSETKAIKIIFKKDAYSLMINSIKSMIGHTIGGAGAIGCATAALSLYYGIIPPTINYEEPDPECDLDYVPNTAREVGNLETAMVNSFGFGGHNCSLVLEKHK